METEARLQLVLNTVRYVGFESLESMMLQYYTASLKTNAGLADLQRRGRQRDLRQLLMHLSEGTSPWPRREAQGFQEGVLAASERLIRSEAQEFARNTLDDEASEDGLTKTLYDEVCEPAKIGDSNSIDN